MRPRPSGDERVLNIVVRVEGDGYYKTLNKWRGAKDAEKERGAQSGMTVPQVKLGGWADTVKAAASLSHSKGRASRPVKAFGAQNVRLGRRALQGKRAT